MHRFALILAVWLAMPALAMAADGWQGELTQEVAIDPQLIAMFGGMLGGLEQDPTGPDSQDDVLGLASPDVTTSKVYYGNGMLRVEEDLGRMQLVTLTDMQNMVVYSFNNLEKVANKMTVPDLAGPGGDPMGLALLQPTDLFMHWEDLSAQFEANENMVVNKLASKTINGLECRGISFSMTAEAVEAQLSQVMPPAGGRGGASPESDAAAGELIGGLFGALLGGGISGEFWFNDGIDIPVLLKLNAGMTSMTATLDKVRDWKPEQRLLSVPQGYEIREDHFGTGGLGGQMEDIGPMQAPDTSV